MKKILFFLATIALISGIVSCSEDTESYADLLENEENSIDYLINKEKFNIKKIDEETVKDWTDKVLNDSIDPATLMELNQWYQVTEGYFKRLYFKINKWGDYREKWLRWNAYKDSLANNLTPIAKPDSVSFYKNKMITGSYVLVRYDSLYNMTDSLDIHVDNPSSNLDPYSYEIIYGWNEYYYAYTNYAYSYGSSSSFACTSGGLAFAPRFLWYDSEVSLIVPFSLVSTDYSSYYYTLYYGKVKYTKPNYLPE